LLPGAGAAGFCCGIEDTDPGTQPSEYVTAFAEDLRWLGLDWQEGPEVGGTQALCPVGREGNYAGYYQRLENAGLAYACFCTPAELALTRKAQLAAGRPPRYPGTCARLGEAGRRERLDRGLQATLRFRVPAGRTVEFTDLIRGPQRVASDDIGDFVIRRADGTPQFFSPTPWTMR